MIIPSVKLLKGMQGMTFDFRFQYLSGINHQSQPVDLTDYTAQWQITSGSTVLENYTSSGFDYNQSISGVYIGSSNNDPTTGIIDLVLSSSDTNEFAWNTASYLLTLTNTITNVKIPLLMGSIFLMPGLIPISELYPNIFLLPALNLLPS